MTGALSTVKTGLTNPRRAVDHLRYLCAIRWYLWRYGHTEGYRRLMRYRITHLGPEQAVGGFDHDIGQLQFEFLKEEGMKPGDTLLDIGCGTLRGGRYAIPYLDDGHYTGIDISGLALEEGVGQLEGLVGERGATLIVNDGLTFREVPGRYDYALAQSVFTHLPVNQIDECLSNIGRVVDGAFYATFSPGPQSSPKDFGYDETALVELAERHGHAATVVPEAEYPHPRGQRMLRITVGGETA